MTAPPILNDALLLGTRIFKFRSQLLSSKMEEESPKKAREYDNLETCLRTFIGVRIRKTLLRN